METRWKRVRFYCIAAVVAILTIDLVVVATASVRAQERNAEWIVPKNVVVLYLEERQPEAEKAALIRGFIRNIGEEFDIRSIAITSKVTGTKSVIIVVGPARKDPDARH